MRVPRPVMAVGGVVLAAGLFAITTPGAVRAAAAMLLVEVKNTASNPVASSEVTLAPAQLVELSCNEISCTQMQPGGGVVINSQYVVPAGKTLVITDLEIYGGGTFGFEPDQNSCSSCNSVLPLEFRVGEDGLTHHFSLTRGIPWPSGAVLKAAQGSTWAYVFGYLANN